MTNISIFCKSYRGDLVPAAVMVESVRRYNRDNLSLYIAVPQADLELFKARIGIDYVHWLTDEEVIAANPAISLPAFQALPGHISQQIVKAEFWRVNPHDNYVCTDSDSRFIREFQASDFLTSKGEPYTILHEGKPFMQFCLANGIHETDQYFEKMSQDMREHFGRKGPSYSYNPFPVIWSKKVWQDLAKQLQADGSNMLDAIVAHPYESSWYGEALLMFQSIPLMPKEPIFKAYLYLEEYEHDRGMGIDEAILAKHYLGVVYQTNWYPHRLQPLKRMAYKLKRRLKRWRA